MSRKTAKQSTYLCALSVLINFLLTKYFCIMKTFLNQQRMFEALVEIYTDAIDNAPDYEDYIEELADVISRDFVGEMQDYAHKRDTSIAGNFRDIRHDWENNHIKSAVIPFCTWDEVVRDMDNGTISDTDLANVQTWVQDWFFDAFGTWGLVYNFRTAIAEMEYTDEENENN